MENYNETPNLLRVIFEISHRNLIINLDYVLKTELIKTKICNMPIIEIMYKDRKCEYFDFLDVESATKFKKAVDQKENFLILTTM